MIVLFEYLLAKLSNLFLITISKFINYGNEIVEIFLFLFVHLGMERTHNNATNLLFIYMATIRTGNYSYTIRISFTKSKNHASW